MLISCLIFLLFQQSFFAFNQPIFCSNATWNSTGLTFADNQTLQSNIWDIFITRNNTIYVPASNIQRILTWFDSNPMLMTNISIDSFYTYSVFVTENNSIYFDYQNSSTISGINRLITSNVQSIVESCDICYDVFVDIGNNVYCSMSIAHRVIRKSLSNLSNPIQIIAGTGINGSTANTLNYPLGIFVDTNFDLYVADRYNHRIQLFPIDQTDGITVAGNGSVIPTIILFSPGDVVLDGNKYLFIVDQGNHRIVANGPNGFRCLIGCNENSSSFSWRSMSFDTFGNIFAVDTDNDQIQKFVLLTNSCS